MLEVEEKENLKEKKEESARSKKAQILSKREKPDTKGTSLFNFSILETGDESMFMEAFDNFAKENPFAADKVRDDVMDAVKKCHQIVHEMGAPRISTTIRLGTRVDKAQTMKDKIKSVKDKL